MLLKRYFLVIALCFFILLLRVKTLSHPSGSDSISFYNDKGEVALVGMVAEPPETRGKWQKLKMQNIKYKMQNLKGSILVKTRLYPKFHYGDILRLTGNLELPPEFEDFSYKEYLEIEGIYSLMDFPKIELVVNNDLRLSVLQKLKKGLFSKIYLLRERFEQVINQILPEPHASLLAGIVFGIERNYTKQFYDSMQKAGVLHIIVASGYNIVIVSSFFLGLASIFGRKKNLILVVTGILLYAVIAGLEPPIVRAAIIGGGAILAEAFGKRKDALLWLGIAAFLMLFANPLLYKSVSFQLSFGAALGLLLFESTLQKFFRKVPAIFRESLTTTLAVQILTLPVVYFNFHEIGFFSLIVNTLVLGTIPFIMGIGAVAVFIGLINVSLSQLLVFPVWLLLEYFVRIVEVFR